MLLEYGTGELTGVYVWLRLLGTVLIGVPAAIGAFWGAPLIAAELETHTARLVWTQTVTRRRWLATKLAVIAVVCVVTVGVFAAAFTTWATPIDDVGNRIGTANFGQRGIVPISYALFALTLGTLLGLVIRRTLPAMAATVVTFIAVRMAFQQARPSASDRPGRDVVTNIRPAFARRMDPVDAHRRCRRSHDRRFREPDRRLVQHHPADPRLRGRHRACARSLGIHDVTRLHPADHFWTLQYYEFGAFVVLAAVLAIGCIYVVRRTPG